VSKIAHRSVASVTWHDEHSIPEHVPEIQRALQGPTPNPASM